MEQKLIEFSFNVLNQVKLFHWATKSYAAHKALGDLHDLLSESVDDLVESYIGAAGRQPLGFFEVHAVAHTDLKQTIPFLKDASASLRRIRTDLKASELQNKVDEMLGALDKTSYLLNLN
jgi:hypothetical protein